MGSSRRRWIEAVGAGGVATAVMGLMAKCVGDDPAAEGIPESRKAEAEVEAAQGSVRAESGSGQSTDGETGAGEEERGEKLDLVRIEGGSFMMGTARGDKLAYGYEHPRHEVTLASFYLARTPVTNGQYKRYLQANPQVNEPDVWHNASFNQPRQPVVDISWFEAKAYCDWAGLVLPTEAQWEYACRAGTQTRYWSGDEEADLARVGWYEGNSDDRLHPVAQLPANPWGLHDMHGNTFEWCLDGAPGDDEFAPYETPPRPGDGLRREPVGVAQVMRSGHFAARAEDARSASRFIDVPSWHLLYYGFRPARSIT